MRGIPCQKLLESDIDLNRTRFQEFVKVVNSNIYESVQKVSKKMKNETEKDKTELDKDFFNLALAKKVNKLDLEKV